MGFVKRGSLNQLSVINAENEKEGFIRLSEPEIVIALGSLFDDEVAKNFKVASFSVNANNNGDWYLELGFKDGSDSSQYTYVKESDCFKAISDYIAEKQENEDVRLASIGENYNGRPVANITEITPTIGVGGSSTSHFILKCEF